MRREICGECGSPIRNDGSCICTELLKRGWRKCANGQKTTQWCQMAEDVHRELREQRQSDTALLRQALTALEGIEKWASRIHDGYPPSTAREAARAAIAALRERLDEGE